MRTCLYGLVLSVATFGTSGCDFKEIEAKTQQIQAEVEAVNRSIDLLAAEQQSLILETTRIQNNAVRPATRTAHLKRLEEQLAATTQALDETVKALNEQKEFLSNYTAQFGKR
jgi:uncharacterized protein (DUF3084 family)